MELSSKGLELIKRFEGRRLVAYKPVASEPYYTIGYGHCGPDIKKGQIIDQAKADELLKQDIQKFVRGVNLLVRNVNQNQFDALVSFAYNCGLGSLKASTLLRMVISKRYDAAASEFKRWNRAGGKVLLGLTRRREAERALFMGEKI